MVSGLADLRKLIKKEFNLHVFDIIHPERGAIFGLVKEFGTDDDKKAMRRKLCNLRLKKGCHLLVLIPAQERDDDPA